MLWYFTFFLISGFCGILYELIWLRLAMAQFGVTTPIVSMVLSAFMGGLGVGSLGAGLLIRRYGHRIKFPALWLYAGAELMIGFSALAVPFELLAGHRLLSQLASSTQFSSVTYSLISGVCIAIAMVPWCAFMGATIPLAMFAVRSDSRLQSRHSFSFLYVSNLLGAVLGAIVPLALIEFHGFHFTLQIGMLLNCLIAFSAYRLMPAQGPTMQVAPEQKLPAQFDGQRRILVLLFMTGLTSMGIEVVWIRLFTPFVGVMVYSFAVILLTYLAASFLGSAAYREFGRNTKMKTWAPVAALALFAVLPVFASQPATMNLFWRMLLGIAPFSAAVGYLTPQLVDLWSEGDADRAAYAYAMNVLGCIVGPLLSGFILLPLLKERWILFLFAVPWLLIASSNLPRQNSRAVVWSSRIAVLFFAVLTVLVAVKPKAFETLYPRRVVRRDNTATVIAAGRGMQKVLLVNGVGITKLTPATKSMAHLPLAFLDHQPESALVICFGMGTTFRSVLSWGIQATAVDVVPSVPKLFWYYHPDGPELLRSPLSHIVIDDGRRYLDRTSNKFDVITIDPPPPVSAAGSSLLYSTEFYRVAKERLRPHGILAQWLPIGYADFVTRSSVAQAIKLSFAHVRVLRPVEGWGYHFVASDWPIPERDAQDLARRLGVNAAKDFVEWGPEATPQGQFNILLKNEVSLDSIIAGSPKSPPLQDDRPTNEYFAVRSLEYPYSRGSTPAQDSSASGETATGTPR
jgi:spermidine synthase